MRMVVVAVAAGLLLVGCGEPSGSEIPELQQEVDQNGAFDLRVGQAVSVGALRIVFQAVPQDSRCPRSVVCAWMGDGTVQLGLRRGGEDEEVRELHTHPDFASRAEVGGVVVALVELRPYPDEPAIIPQGEYVARLTVTRR